MVENGEVALRLSLPPASHTFVYGCDAEEHPVRPLRLDLEKAEHIKDRPLIDPEGGNTVLRFLLNQEAVAESLREFPYDSR
jgi:hypothetical protein